MGEQLRKKGYKYGTELVRLKRFINKVKNPQQPGVKRRGF